MRAGFFIADATGAMSEKIGPGTAHHGRLGAAHRRDAAY